MKQLLFLLLFPCLAMAQYPGNANQKITLGEQTTADGLVFRGVANLDTVTATSKITRANKQDTSAYLLLDTVTNLLWHYKIGSNAWTQAGGGDTSLIAYVNTYGTQTVNGAKTFTSAVTGASFRPTSSTIPTNGIYLPNTNTLGFSTNSTSRFLISSDGNLSTDSVSKTTATYRMFELGKSSGTTVLAGRLDGFNEFLIGLNLYYAGGANFKYIGNGFSSYYRQRDGSHSFFRSTSGSAGGDITPIESMRITSDGNLMLFGNSNPLVISSNNSTTLYTTYQYNTNTDVGYVGNGVGTVTGGAASDFGITAQTGNLLFASGGVTERMRITSGGNVGIGTTGPQEKLHVVGNARITGAYDVTTGSASNVFVTTDGVLQRSTSSIKYKTDVEDYSKGLKEVMQLRPVTFKSINSNNDKTYAGFIAEELADLKLNELVENNDSGEPDAISYAYMVTLLTKAIQEQQEQISQLKKRLFILENK